MRKEFQDLDINKLPFHVEFDDFDLSIMMRNIYQNVSLLRENEDYIQLPTIKLTYLPAQKGVYLYSKEVKTTDQLINLIEEAINYCIERYQND